MVSNFLYNSDRWSGFAVRDGDIVIAPPGKCGTTWTQRIVSLLIFDSPDLYAPMARISPWLDMNTRPLDEVLRELEDQTHRRFVKSHLDYALLPHDDRVTYICVGRDPRDVAVSWIHHIANVDMERLVAQRVAAVGADDLAPVEDDEDPVAVGDENDPFWNWLESEGEGLEGMVHHVKTFRDARNEPNVVLLHYADLQRDLVEQMVYLADRLRIRRSRKRLEELARFAGFDAMKESASMTAPNADQALWKETSDFFHKGQSGQWRAFMSEADVPRYEQRVRALAGDDDLVEWLHHGGMR